MISRSTLTGLVTLLGLLGFFAPIATAAERVELLMLTVKIMEQGGPNEPTKILAEPAIVSVTGRPFALRSGGKMKAKFRDEDWEIGTRLAGRIDRTADGTLRLTLDVTVARPVPPAAGAAVEVVRCETLEIGAALRPGETKRLEISPATTCEIRIDPAPVTPEIRR